MIEVRLFAFFREGRDKIIFMSPEKMNTISDILAELNISVDDLAICLINGMHSKPEDTVKADDIVALFPPVAGG